MGAQPIAILDPELEVRMHNLSAVRTRQSAAPLSLACFDFSTELAMRDNCINGLYLIRRDGDDI